MQLVVSDAPFPPGDVERLPFAVGASSTFNPKPGGSPFREELLDDDDDDDDNNESHSIDTLSVTPSVAQLPADEFVTDPARTGEERQAASSNGVGRGGEGNDHAVPVACEKPQHDVGDSRGFSMDEGAALPTPPFVPAEVLDDANRTISLLMQEIERLHDELAAASSRGGVAMRPSVDDATDFSDALSPIAPQPPSPAAQGVDDTTHLVPNDTTPQRRCGGTSGDNGSFICKAQPPRKESTFEVQHLGALPPPSSSSLKNDHDVAQLQAVIQQRNRSLHQQSKLLAEERLRRAELEEQLRKRDAAIDVSLRREATFAREIEGLKRSLSAAKAQQQALRDRWQESTDYFVGILSDWKRREELGLPVECPGTTTS